jgi:uncharacterized repeat protein (TIGR01451 family)
LIATIRRAITRRNICVSTFLSCFFAAGTLLVASTAWAVGTDAGVNIQNTATAAFDINGTPQAPVSSNTVQTTVDELLDVVVVDDIGGPVAVSSGEVGAILQFTITNNGNGSETYRIIADDGVNEGGFDPQINQLYIESNGLPGLQVGGDTAYVSGAADPTLLEDESLVLYVQSNIPAALNQGDNGDVAVRAVSQTIITATGGIDDPDDVGWPVPGASYAGAGDGGGNAVVGTSNDINNLLMRTVGRYQVSNAVVNIVKTAINVLDPFGGVTLVPGSIITYQLEITVTGSGTAQALVISDVIPLELDYQLTTLVVAGVAEDDDFAPAGVDNSGYDPGTASVRVDQGDVAGGSPSLIITFDAAIR